MSHYSSFLRSYHSKSTKSSSASIPAVSNENDENSSIKNLILKHVTKGQPSTSKSSMRGILGEVGNMTLNSKPVLSKSKVVQQQNSLESLIECQTIVAVPPPAPPPPCASTAITVDEILADDEEPSMANVSAEFDCDSADLLNITTASEYVVDICKYWRELEQHTLIRPNFLLNRAEGRRSSRTWIVPSLFLSRHCLGAESSGADRLALPSSRPFQASLGYIPHDHSTDRSIPADH